MITVEYNEDCVNVEKFFSPRFASEYGWQAFPSLKSLKKVSIKGDLEFDSKFVKHRQHHKDGNSQLWNQIKRQFRDPKGNNKEQEFIDFAYLSQCVQSLCIKSQTEHYRRGSGTKAHTMGALYWQFNDIWQAPTWSSIEYSGEWKMLHYQARHFFNQFLITAYTQSNMVYVYLTNDLPVEIKNIDIQLNLYDFKEGKLQWSIQLKDVSIGKITSKEMFKMTKEEFLRNSYCQHLKNCFLKMIAKSGEKYSSENVHYLEKLRFSTLEDVEFKISNIEQVNEKTIKFEIISSNVAPYVFIQSSLFGRFSDNGFLMLKGEKRIIHFYGWSKIKNFENSLTVKSMNPKIIN